MSASRLVGGIILIAVCAAWAYILFAGEPRLQIDIANGTYSNPCCGVLTLNDGTMSVEKQRFSYVIEQDKAGSYVLPKGYVGASDHGFVFRPSGYPLKLKLDLTANPHHVKLLDDSPGGASYSFARTNGS